MTHQVAYVPGDWNSICYRCGRTYKASTLRREWEGFYVCSLCWEVRQPQDFVRAPPDQQSPPWTQDRPDPLWARFCTPNGRTAIAGAAVAGCAISGHRDPLFDPSIVVIF